jgi:hypothetical protein
VKNFARVMRSVFDCGGIRINPWHISVSAFAQCGGERGSGPLNFAHATRYRLRQWKTGRIENALSGGEQISATGNPNGIFSLAC